MPGGVGMERRDADPPFRHHFGNGAGPGLQFPRDREDLSRLLTDQRPPEQIQHYRDLLLGDIGRVEGMLHPADLARTDQIRKRHGPALRQIALDEIGPVGTAPVSDNQNRGPGDIRRRDCHDRHGQVVRPREAFPDNGIIPLRGMRDLHRDDPGRLRLRDTRHSPDRHGGNPRAPAGLRSVELIPQQIIDGPLARQVQHTSPAADLMGRSGQRRVHRVQIETAVQRAIPGQIVLQRGGVVIQPTVQPLDGRGTRGLLPTVRPVHVGHAVAFGDPAPRRHV